MGGRPQRQRANMKLKEIRELLVLKEWSREHLAGLLQITRNTIDRWFSVEEKNQRFPSPEHVEKMRRWLNEAREETRKQPA